MMAYMFLGALFGMGGGGLAAFAVMSRMLARERGVSRVLRAQRDEAAGAHVKLAELQGQISALRHDVRSILSPALLVADRLMSNQDAGIKRAGEVMIRTVERAVSRLAETRIDQHPSNMDQA